MERLSDLSDAEFRVFSQWGEDGILEWLLQRLPITSTRFIEFGVQDYSEANTRFLLVNRNWKGLIIDSSQEYMSAVRQEELYWRHDLTAITAFIDRDNINELISKNDFSGNIGLLSIDIDGNDYWVWEAITTAVADVIVCEYNALFGDLHPLTIPYKTDFRRDAAHSSGLYRGASIAALRLLAVRRGYEFIGTNRSGTNAFFVRKELLPIIDPVIASKRAHPSPIRESRDQYGNLTFISGLQRAEEIGDLPVVRLDSGKTVPLRSLSPLYSNDWLSAMHIDPSVIRPNIQRSEMA